MTYKQKIEASQAEEQRLLDKVNKCAPDKFGRYPYGEAALEKYLELYRLQKLNTIQLGLENPEKPKHRVYLTKKKLKRNVGWL